VAGFLSQRQAQMVVVVWLVLSMFHLLHEYGGLMGAAVSNDTEAEARAKQHRLLHVDHSSGPRLTRFGTCRRHPVNVAVWSGSGLG
jgi:hypothetical protein